MHQLTQPAPLQRFVVVDTTSPDEAQDKIGRIFCPHELAPQDRQPEHFHARHHSATQQHYSVNFVAYGSRVTIDPGQLSRFFLLQLPINGSAEVICGKSRTQVSAGTAASILSPSLPTRMTWEEGCEKIIILQNRDFFESQYRALSGRTAHDPIEFPAGIDLTTSAGQLLQAHANLMLAAADFLGATPAAYLARLGEGLAHLLLTGFQHSCSAILAAPVAAPTPAIVRRAENYIEANADRHISMADVAEAAGVCLRTLQEAFRQFRQTTLSETLQTVRLERFRAALSDPDSTKSVTEIAFEIGFGHLGRASAAYRLRFGETPSQTQRRVGNIEPR